MSTFLVSWLSGKYGALDASIFLREQPGEWLVLESDGGRGEPIATRLALRRDRPRFTLGRDPGADLVLSEPAIALAHAVLEPDEEGGWNIRRASPEHRVQLDGLQLGDFPVPLGSGARIELGGVRLVYYAGADLHARLLRANRSGAGVTPP